MAAGGGGVLEGIGGGPAGVAGGRRVIGGAPEEFVRGRGDGATETAIGPRGGAAGDASRVGVGGGAPPRVGSGGLSNVQYSAVQYSTVQFNQSINQSLAEAGKQWLVIHRPNGIVDCNVYKWRADCEDCCC
jgi:hypothetical protein